MPFVQTRTTTVFTDESLCTENDLPSESGTKLLQIRHRQVGLQPPAGFHINCIGECIYLHDFCLPLAARKTATRQTGYNITDSRFTCLVLAYLIPVSLPIAPKRWITVGCMQNVSEYNQICQVSGVTATGYYCNQLCTDFRISLHKSVPPKW